MGTRIKYLMIFGILVLIVGGVVAVSLADKIKIEKVGDTYIVYVKKTEYKESELTNEKKMLEDLMKDCENEIYSSKDCMNVCEITCGIDMEIIEGLSFEECMEVCEFGCHAEKDTFETQKQMDIEIFGGKISEIDEVIKSK